MLFFVCDDVFSERARLTDGGDAEDFIAHIEPFHPRPDGFDHAGEIMAQAARKPEPGKHSHFATANFPVHRVGCRSPDLNANSAPPGFGLLYLVQPQFRRAAIVEILNALHEGARPAPIGTIATLIVALASRILLRGW